MVHPAPLARLRAFLRLLAIAVFTVLASGCATEGSDPAASKPPETVSLLRACPAADDPCLRRALQDVTTRQGARDATGQLEQLAAARTLAPARCHQLAHTIGITAAARSATTLTQTLGWIARSEPGHLCRAGVTHGILGELVSSSSDDARRRLLAARCARSMMPRAAADCAHGVGHGLALISDDSGDEAASVPRCLALDLQLRAHCWSGMFMEWFEPTDLRRAPRPALLTSCDELLLAAREPCWFQAASARFAGSQPITDPAPSCRHRLDAARRACTRAWATMLTTASGAGPNQADTPCSTIDQPLRPACIEGVVTSLVGDGHDRLQIARLCRRQQDAEVRGSCNRWADAASITGGSRAAE